jgi:heavy metal sensor kinase
MPFAKIRSATSSLAFRLSLMYAALCFLSVVAVLLISYLVLDHSMKSLVDEDLIGEVFEYRALMETQEMPVLFDVLDHEADSEGTGQTFFRVVRASGETLYETDMSEWPDVTVKPELLARANRGEDVFDLYQNPAQEFPARLAYGSIGEGLVLQLGESTTVNEMLLRQFRRVFFGAAAAFLFCSFLAGGYMGRRALAGVQRLTLAAGQIAAGAWEHRVPVSHRHDELDELAAAFNLMVDRIQVLFRELREVTDDIAHDLRTPLMRIRGEAEMALREDAPHEPAQELFGSVLEECDQMLNLINTMLEISQTESGAVSMERAVVDLGELAEDICELFRPAAEDKDIDLRYSAESETRVSGHSQRLQRALAHLVDNAIKYTAPGGQVEVRCGISDGNAFVKVSDTGLGIPAAALAEVFSRFYRVDASRTEPGNGLGLSLAQAIIRAHGGAITVESEEGRGSTFTLRVPEMRESD